MSGPDGFILPLVLIIGLILLVGGLATLARSFGGLLGAIRQEQAGQAREIAENGLARTVGRLNRQWPYLLINCYASNGSVPATCSGTWSNPALPSAICPDHDTVGSPSVSGTTTQPAGRYRIDSYTFSGTQFYGGTAKIKVIGERLGSDGTTVVASAMVEEEFDVKPKNCDARYGQPATSSGFPGLLGWQINLGNNSILGKTSGNVLCIHCTSIVRVSENGSCGSNPAILCIGPGSIIGGSPFIGPIAVPPVPVFPSNLSAVEKPITTDKKIIAGETNGGMCAVENSTEPITHCKISSIQYDNGPKKLLEVDTTNGPVRLYVSGNIEIGGQSGIIQARNGKEPEAARLGIFGNPLDLDNTTPDQNISLAGSSKPAKAADLFAFFPDAIVGINGGAQASATCDESGECGGGDVRGAIWAKSWNGSGQTSIGSNSRQAELTVPADMADLLLKYYGTQFAISVRDYVGLGVNSWRGFQGF